MNRSTLPEDFWTRLDAKFDKLDDKLEHITDEMADLRAQGCAQLPNEQRRIDNLESWRDRGVVGIIVALLTGIGSLIAVIYTHIISGK